MLGDWQTHSQFQELLLNELAARWPIDQQRIVHFASVLEAAWLTNLILPNLFWPNVAHLPAVPAIKLLPSFGRYY